MSITFYVPGLSEDFTMNVANRNGRLLQENLGYEPEYVGELDPQEILKRIRRVRRAFEQGQGKEFTRLGRVTRYPKGAMCVDCGASEDYLLDRLAQLERIALAAKLKGTLVEFS